MLTKLICRNFKNFGEVEVELGNPLSSLDRITLAKLQLYRHSPCGILVSNVGTSTVRGDRRRKNDRALLSTGATLSPSLCRMQGCSGEICRSEMFRELVVGNRRKTSAWILSLKVLPVANKWECGLEFDYANQESFYCRPLRLPEREGED